MVPHGRVEALVAEVVARLADRPAGAAPPEVVVTAVADERKGEQLCVVHTALGVAVESVVAALAASDLPRLFLPRASSFVEVEALPRTGTGKIDLAGAKRMAESALASVRRG
jgi:acyl-[acyl-carrier-protein]-phospholipid O-acyltransferase/long-chain-fatty-acid--[acyl-carrier-protein] ligase